MADLTIVIVNWNSKSLLLRCLESIRRSRCSATVHVIVVDNHSRDGSREAVTYAFPEITVIDSGSNLGFGRANNLARKCIHTSLVLFLNPDTELQEDTLERAVHCLSRQHDVGALGCRMLYPDGRVQEPISQWQMTPWAVLFEFLLVTQRSRHYLRRLLGRWIPCIDPSCSGYALKICGGFMMVKKEILDAVGWFDDRYFMYAEDADLSRSIRALGWRLYHCGEAATVHVTGGASASAPSTFSYLMRQESVNQYIEKYQGRSAAILHRVAVLVGSVTRLAVVMMAWLVALLQNQRRAAAWSASLVKYQHLLLWSVGLKEPMIPEWEPPAAVPLTRNQRRRSSDRGRGKASEI